MMESPARPPLSVARIDAADPGLAGILASIRTAYGRDSQPIRRDVEAGRAEVRAVFEGEGRAGFIVLADYRDPLFHIGNRIDPRLARAFLEDPRRRIWVIAFLHGEPGTAHPLRELGEAMLGAACGADPEETVVLVSLPRGGDPRSWRLFRALGFREEGAPSWFGEIDLAAHPVRRRAHAGVEIVRLDASADPPAEALAVAYNEVFAEGHPLLSAGDVRAIASGPEWSGEVSLAVRDRGTGDLVGFLFAGRREGESIHIDCVGIRPAWRGRGILEAGFEAFRERAIENGIRRSTFVTGIRGVERLAARRFGARIVDELVWLVRRPGGGA
ncbi:MAG: GNAT family N-acetyltransferase [Planctomycetes bacterium]|nr:GNAT family N-acetyltransferase [Planctomycetota bacterium]